jgi:hypothetical protein
MLTRVLTEWHVEVLHELHELIKITANGENDDNTFPFPR